MRSLHNFILLGMVSIVTTACMGPSVFPRGYSSYGEEFKSVKGNKAPSMGYEYSQEKNAEVVAALKIAAQDLAGKLDRKLSFAEDKLYLKMPGNGGFYNTFDHLLREALSEHGYVFSSEMANSVTVDLVTRDLTGTACRGLINNGEEPVFMALAINSVDGVATKTAYGIYQVPLYGFYYAGSVRVELPDCAD